MREKTRGAVEGVMDTVLEFDRVHNVSWVEQEIPIRSMEDLALGFAVGELMVRAVMLIALVETREPTNKDRDDIRVMVKRRLPEIMDKINRELHR